MPKARYYAKDLRDWTRFYGLRIGQPPVFPVNSVKAMRGALFALDRGVLPRYARSVFEAYWGDLKDISQDEVLAPLAEAAGLSRGDFFAAIAKPEYKDRLRANTDELIARGGFGSPTMFVNGERHVLRQRPSRARRAALPLTGATARRPALRA